MKRKILLAVIFTFVCMIFITSKGYTAPEGIKRGITDDMIKLGFINSITGMGAANVVPVLDGIRNYTRYINDNGGIHGRKIKLIAEDDRLTVPGSVAAFKKLVYKDGIFTLIGPASGGPYALKDQFIKEKLPTFAMAASEDMTKPYTRYIFIPLDTYENQIGIILDYILETTKIKNPKIVNAVIDTGAKSSIIRGFDRWTKHFGINYTNLLIPLNVIDTTAEMLTLKKEGADYIIVTHVIPAAALILKDSKRFGLNVKVYGTCTLTSEDVLKIAGPVTNFYGIHSVSSWYDDTPGVADMRKITLKYHPGTEKSVRPKNYTIGWVIMKILSEGLKRTDKDLDNEKFIDAMETLNNFDTQGLSGPITYTSNDHEGMKYDRIYHADPEQNKLTPISDWRKVPELK
ncbi:MAG: ABC transporter substrate-binding protein [Pseudomonadota bacterium]